MIPNHVKQRLRVAPLARVRALSEANVTRVPDAGARGVLAPNGRTREEAELLVDACRYPPQGSRSLGAGRFPLSFKTDVQTYFARANAEIMTVVQIEHVDAFYVGPNDFCALLGLPPSLEPPHREFEEAMRTVLAAARRHGVVPSIHCATVETVNRRIREGWPFVGMLNDQRLLLSAARAARDGVKTDGGAD